MSDEIKDTFGRFFAHWAAATFGFFLRSLLPVVASWCDPNTPVEFQRWWAALLFAALVCLLPGIFNSNLPGKPQELLKSMGLGFAVDVAALLAKIGPLSGT